MVDIKKKFLAVVEAYVNYSDLHQGLKGCPGSQGGRGGGGALISASAIHHCRD